EQGWATVALQLLVNYKSHHASAFGSHACNCQFCSASWDFSSTTAGGPQSLRNQPLKQGCKLAALQLLPNYKSHEALQDWQLQA
ncbi:unnamed protein product, partial [Staurois parvus]